MKRYGWRIISIVLLFLLVLSGPTRSEELYHIPEGITMQEVFAPGFGDTLGIFKKTVGRVVLVHAKDPLGYWAETDLPLYMKDTIITPEGGLALLQFLDDSTISVAEDSELIINRFIFDPDKFDRSTFLNMKSGRSRFWVKKLEQFSRSEFKVKTKTMIAGVRGSDFVIVITPRGTEVYALDDTVLELINLADPSRIIVLNSFEKITVNEGEPAGAIEKISPAEAARLRSELPMPFDRDVLDAAGIFKAEKTVSPEREETREQPTDEIVQTEEGEPGGPVKEETVPTPAGEEGGPPAFEIEDETAATEAGEGGGVEGPGPLFDIGGETVIILIAEEDLVEPDPPVEGAGAGPPEDLVGFDPGQAPGAAGGAAPEDIVEQAAQEVITNDVILVDLPGPPVTP